MKLPETSKEGTPGNGLVSRASIPGDVPRRARPGQKTYGVSLPSQEAKHTIQRIRKGPS